MMSSYLLMVASYLLVTFLLGSSVRIVQTFKDGVLAKLLLYLQHGFLTAAFPGQHLFFGFPFLSQLLVIGEKVELYHFIVWLYSI